MKRQNLRKLTVTAVLSAVASVLMFLNFPIPIMPPFIKFDFSELPALIAAFAIGPWSGVAVCLIKNIVNLASTMTGGVGELSNFILGTCFTFTAGAIYKRHRTITRALIGAVLGALLMAVISFFTNYYIVYPIYTKIMPIEKIIGMYQAINPSIDGLKAALLIFNVPFTFVKGIANTAVAFLIYKHISPFLHGRER